MYAEGIWCYGLAVGGYLVRCVQLGGSVSEKPE